MNIEPTNPFEFVRKCLEDGRAEEASQFLRRHPVHEYNPADQGIFAALSYMCFIDLGNEEAADAVLDHLQSNVKRAPEMLEFAAEELLDYALIDEGLELLRALYETHPSHLSYALFLAESLFDDHQFDECIEVLRTILEADPEMAEAHKLLGECLEMKDDFAGALEHFHKAAELLPNDAETWIVLGRIYTTLGEFAAAYDALSRAEPLAPDPVWMEYAWAVAAYAGKDRPRLAQCLVKLDALEASVWQKLMVESFIAELDGEFFKGWERLTEALDLVIDETDRLNVQNVVGAIVQYGLAHGLKDELKALMPKFNRAEAFSEPILAGLRHAGGDRIAEARDFEIEVEGEVADAEHEQDLTEHYETAPPFRFLRTYRVLAANEADARRTVEDFERRCGAARIIIHAVQPTPWTGEAESGVWQRSAAQYFSSTGEILES